MVWSYIMFTSWSKQNKWRSSCWCWWGIVHSSYCNVGEGFWSDVCQARRKGVSIWKSCINFWMWSGTKHFLHAVYVESHIAGSIFFENGFDFGCTRLCIVFVNYLMVMVTLYCCKLNMYTVSHPHTHTLAHKYAHVCPYITTQIYSNMAVFIGRKELRKFFSH